MRMFLTARFAGAILILSCTFHANAADNPKPLFGSDAVLTLTLSGPIHGLSRKVGAEPVPGMLRVSGDKPEELPILLSTRGVTRRMIQICAFPPIRVEFAKKPGKGSLFRGQKRLKLVTHCQSQESYQQGVLLEYSAYRLYNALTPQSFDVRLAKINYTDEEGSPIITRFGFFEEDISDVAARNGLTRLRGVNHISSSQIDPISAARFAMFQYFISNLDWAMTASIPGEDCCHNSRLLTAKGATTGLVTVPYDFDSSGLVDAPYALPPDGIHVANVRVRRYRGFCAHNEQAQVIASEMLARRADLLGIVDKTPELSDRSREKAANYLGEFFDRIGSPQELADVMATCLR